MGVRDALLSLSGAAAFLDAVAEVEGKGAGYVSDVAKAEAAAAAQDQFGYAETAAAALVGYVLVQYMAGVRLDRDDPFSDASISGALSQVLGVPVVTVRQRAALIDVFKRAATHKLSEITGEQFEDAFDRQLLRRDLLRATGRHAGEVVPGLVLHDLSNRSVTIDDIDVCACLYLSDILGFRIQSLRSGYRIKEDIYAWAAPIIAAESGQGSIEYKHPLKMDRKHVRNREAVRRFREKWGRRERYQGVNEGGGNGG